MMKAIYDLLLALRTVLATLFCIHIVGAAQIAMNGDVDPKPVPLEFSGTWTVLGPFRIGTREASWGADPLERYGGFQDLVYGDDVYRSALGPRGLVSWTKKNATLESDDQTVTAQLDVQFPEVDFSSLRGIYGWAALQHQAWARGYLVNDEETRQRIVLFTDGILELYINGQHHWGGDFYGFRRAPVVLVLEPGANQIDIRLIHDVRAMGGTEPPTISVGLEARLTDTHLSVDYDSIVLSDLVDGKLPSPYASITCRNDDEEILEITSVESEIGTAELISEIPIRLIPGQSRTLSLQIAPGADSRDQVIVFNLSYRKASNHESIRQELVILTLRSRPSEEPHKFTFLHSSGSVSYAILKPPSDVAQSTVKGPLPVFLALHGAGLEADSYLVRHSLDEVPDLPAWTLFPTGSSPWSGDDWHTYGFSDILAAVRAVPSWLEAMQWVGSGVDTGKWFVSGHSNGGQGSWYILTHQPDKVIAAAPASGYTSIQNYVPYTFWQDSDPRLNALLQSTLASFRHELLVSNFGDIPTLHQHGSADDNVPVFHSRLMAELIDRTNPTSRYAEVESEGHWWDGVMTTTALKVFYQNQLVGKKDQPTNITKEFTTVIPNTFDMGCRGGVCVDQLTSPDLLGEVHGSWSEDGTNLQIRTSNVHRLHINAEDARISGLVGLTVDNQQLIAPTSKDMWAIKGTDGIWKASEDKSWQSIYQRYGKQVGALDAILRTPGPFSIWTTNASSDAGLQISRNFLQYFGIDSNIITSGLASTSTTSTTGNRILVIEAQEVPDSELKTFPIEIVGGCVTLRLANGAKTSFHSRSGLGAIFIRPLPNEQLELVVWGADKEGVKQASRLVPTLTGVGQPDFIVMDGSTKWKGLGGVLAAGHFDYQWNISSGSYIK